MVCPQCKTANPEDAVACIRCTNPLGTVAGAGDAAEERETFGSDRRAPTNLEVLVPGAVLASRYELLSLLGEGGMGAVYKALDRELDRVVALKVIRPQLANDPKLLARFKQELILARQISHRNVVRIFDLGVSDGIRFITMEYVEGRELAQILARTERLSPSAAVDIMKQVCMGLSAAHLEGITHRDLKPHNVMVDQQGRARIMDFGIARALNSSRMTRTGALMGTPAYMSPEQANGDNVDARSDLYTAGIIFYEMLTGRVPFEAESFMAMLLKRCQEPPVPPREIDPSIPERLEAVILKALARKPEERYQSAAEIVRDLEAWELSVEGLPPEQAVPAAAAKPGSSPQPLPPRVSPAPALSPAGGTSTIVLPHGPPMSVPPPLPARPSRKPAVWGALALLAILSSGGVLWWRSRPTPRAPGSPPVSVLVADFDNTTTEPVFDGTLEPVFVAGLEDVSFVTMFDRGTAHRIAREIQPGSTRVNEALARLIGTREGVNVIVTGLVARQGDQYRITVNAIDGSTGKAITSEDSPSVPKENVLQAAAKMVPALRQGLGDVAPSSQKAASGETFTGASLSAVHDYATAQDLQWAGKLDQAAASYLKATGEDPTMGRAYAGLAAVSANLGRTDDALKYYQQALALMANMSEREKYRTRGGYFLAIRDRQKAIEEFSALVQQYPADTAGRANLALAYLYARDMRRAVEEGREALKLYPKNALQRNNLALYAVYAGDANTAMEEARAAMAVNPKYEKIYVALAFAALLNGDTAKATENYQTLRAISARGASLAVTGLADTAQYNGQYTSSLRLLEDAGGVDEASKRSLSAANRMILAAEARLAMGDPAQAGKLAADALGANESESIAVMAARIFVRARRDGEARQIAARLDQKLAAESKAYARMIEADILLQQGRAGDAIESLQESKRLTDTWLAHFDLARVYIAAGAFAQAHSELDVCQRRRGEALSLFLDEMPTARYLSLLPYYLGRAQEGLRIPAAAASYKSFLTMRQNAEDPLAADARKRLARLNR